FPAAQIFGADNQTAAVRLLFLPEKRSRRPMCKGRGFGVLLIFAAPQNDHGNFSRLGNPPGPYQTGASRRARRRERLVRSTAHFEAHPGTVSTSLVRKRIQSVRAQLRWL